jgi:hypothetical protein
VTGNPPKFTGPIFDGFQVRPGVPMARLIAGLFVADNGKEFESPAAQLLADVLLATADEGSLVTGAQEGGLDRGPEIDRVLHRIQNRAIIIVEIAKRLEKGDLDEPAAPAEISDMARSLASKCRGGS